MIRSLDEMRTFKEAESWLLKSLETSPGDHTLTTVLDKLRSRHQAHVEGKPYVPIVTGEGERTAVIIFDEVYTFPTPIPLPDLSFEFPFNMILPEPEGIS